MRKTFKTLTAVILAFVIAFGSFTAFAAEDKPVITWNEVEYNYAGTLSEGKNSFEIPSDETFYVTFDAEKPGYYCITYNWREISHFWSPETIENGDITEIKDYEYLNTEKFGTELDHYLFLFEEGENILLSEVGYDIMAGDPSDIEIVYFGEKATDISFAGGTEYFLVPEWNIYEHYDEEEKYPGTSYYITGGETQITFDSGKTISLVNHEFICTFDDEYGIGEKNITVYFFGETFKKTVSIYPVSKVITKVEVENLEKYLDVPVAYNDNIIYDFDGMKITITYSDGYTETITTEPGEWQAIELRNGNPDYYPIDYYYEREDESVDFCVTIASEEFIREDCTLREATGRENRQHLNYRIYEILSDTVWDIRYNFASLAWASNLWEGIIYLRRALFNSADEIFTAFESIVEEVTDCLRG